MDAIDPYISIFCIAVTAIIFLIVTLYCCFCGVSGIYFNRYLSITDHETHCIPMSEVAGPKDRENREIDEHL